MGCRRFIELCTQFGLELRAAYICVRHLSSVAKFKSNRSTDDLIMSRSSTSIITPSYLQYKEEEVEEIRL